LPKSLKRRLENPSAEEKLNQTDVEFSDFFMSTSLSLDKLFHYTGISKIILVKGGHGLENVRLNLFRVTISSVRTIGLPAPFL
jgi:hypothetical protein